jgi:hypothetical protein
MSCLLLELFLVVPVIDGHAPVQKRLQFLRWHFNASNQRFSDLVTANQTPASSQQAVEQRQSTIKPMTREWSLFLWPLCGLCECEGRVLHQH